MSAQSSGMLGRNTERNEVWKSDQSIANNLKASGNIVLNTSQGDVTATHLKANAGETIQVQAKNGHVTLNSALDETSQSSTSSSKNFATYNNRQRVILIKKLHKRNWLPEKILILMLLRI